MLGVLATRYEFITLRVASIAAFFLYLCRNSSSSIATAAISTLGRRRHFHAGAAPTRADNSHINALRRHGVSDLPRCPVFLTGATPPRDRRTRSSIVPPAAHLKNESARTSAHSRCRFGVANVEDFFSGEGARARSACCGTHAKNQRRTKRGDCRPQNSVGGAIPHRFAPIFRQIGIRDHRASGLDKQKVADFRRPRLRQHLGRHLSCWATWPANEHKFGHFTSGLSTWERRWCECPRSPTDRRDASLEPSDLVPSRVVGLRTLVRDLRGKVAVATRERASSLTEIQTGRRRQTKFAVSFECVRGRCVRCRGTGHHKQRRVPSPANRPSDGVQQPLFR